MKARILAMVAAVAIFSGMAHADSACKAGLFSMFTNSASPISCGIGDKTFTFSNTDFVASDPSILDTLYFTPESTATSAGFNISGFPPIDTASPITTSFFDSFSAVPSTGTITSFTATINGLSQDITLGDQSASVTLDDQGNGTSALDNYVSNCCTTTHTQTTGGPESSFGPSPLGGIFSLSEQNTGAGSTRFASADFVFNESTTTTAVPEGPELAMLGLSTIAIFGALRRKSALLGLRAPKF